LKLLAAFASRLTLAAILVMAVANQPATAESGSTSLPADAGSSMLFATEALAIRPMPRPADRLERRENTRLLGQWFGSLGWCAAAGNGGGVGRVFPAWSYRWQADRSGTIDRMRFNLPRRAGYFGGSGGIMRLALRRNAPNDWPDLTPDGILWQSPRFAFSVADDGTMQKHSDLSYPVGFGADEIVDVDIGPLPVKAGQIYHFVWTNDDDDPAGNWYSITFTLPTLRSMGEVQHVDHYRRHDVQCSAAVAALHPRPISRQRLGRQFLLRLRRDIGDGDAGEPNLGQSVSRDRRGLADPAALDTR
jgi:hypothetical protein